MNERKVITFIKYVVLLILPLFSGFCAYSSYPFSFLTKIGLISKNVRIEVFQACAFCINLVSSILMIWWPSYCNKIRSNRYLNQRNQILEYTKTVFTSSLNNNSFNIRVFIPEHNWLYMFNNFRKDIIPTYFVIVNNITLSSEGMTRGLKFQVSPIQEGLVGACYKDRRVIYDTNLAQTNESMYSLNSEQISRTSTLRWSFCCPITSNPGEKVIAIVALDGESNIEFTPEMIHNVEKLLISYSRMLYDRIPDFFRR